METNLDSNSTIASTSADKSLALAKPVDAPLTRAAIFLVVTLSPISENRAALRSFCGDLAGLVRAVEFRDLEGSLPCVVGFASDAWDRLFGPPGRQSCTYSGRFAPDRGMQSHHRAAVALVPPAKTNKT